MTLIQVKGLHKGKRFTAGVEYNTGDQLITKAAPILKKWVGKEVHSLIVWCRENQYKWSYVTATPAVTRTPKFSSIKL